MFRIRTVLLGCAATWALGSAAQAEYVNVALTGWTDDIIAENTATNPITATSRSAHQSFAYAWFESGAPNSKAGQGLPTGGSFTSACNSAVTFQLQPYTSNNAVTLSKSSSPATLTLTTPTAFTSLAFLCSATSGNTKWSATLNFSDGSNAKLDATDCDWLTSSGSNAITNAGLVNRGEAWAGYYTGNVYMFEHDWTLTAEQQAKKVTSITIAANSSNFGMLNFFAVSGEAVAVPEPSTTVILIPIVAGLLAYAWRKRQ